MLSRSESKYIQTLSHKKQRDAEGLFFVEGPKLAEELLNSNYNINKIYATQSWVTSQAYLTTLDVPNYLNKYGDTMYNLLNFDRGLTLSTMYTGCRISIWYDGTNWYGFGMN